MSLTRLNKSRLRYRMFGLLQPSSNDIDLRNREMVLNFLLFGTALLAICAFITTTISFIMGRNPTYTYFVMICAVFIGFDAALYWRVHWHENYYLAAYGIVIIYFIIACLLAVEWSLQLPTGILLFGFVIVLSGIVISSRFSLYMLGAILLVMLLLEVLVGQGFISPNVDWKNLDTALGDLIGFLIIYSLIALVSWLFNSRMEYSLLRARRSEELLKKQKENLEIMVSRRTNQLAQAQLEKVEQIYRFAELGRLSSVLFHDLANHITSIALDIEGLHKKESSEITQRAHDTVAYLDDVVQRVRKQLKGGSLKEQFSVIHEIEQVVKILRPKALENNVYISLEPENSISANTMYKGDLTRYQQLFNNILSNAIESYQKRDLKNTRRIVKIKLSASLDEIVIDISNNGPPIPQKIRKQIFEPFYSTKPTGTGIGLFVVKQISEQDFRGSVTLLPLKKGVTTFRIILPR